MSKRKEFFKRIFLNKEGFGTHAHAIARLTLSNISLRISDCNSTIELHNRIVTNNEKANAIYKISTLRDVCNELLNAMQTSMHVCFSKKNAIRKMPFYSFSEAENFVTEEGFVKTTAPEGLICLGFYQFLKINSYAVIVENPKLKTRKFKVLFF